MDGAISREVGHYNVTEQFHIVKMRLELLISYYNSTTNREDRVHNNMDDAISRTL